MLKLKQTLNQSEDRYGHMESLAEVNEDVWAVGRR